MAFAAVHKDVCCSKVFPERSKKHLKLTFQNHRAKVETVSPSRFSNQNLPPEKSINLLAVSQIPKTANSCFILKIIGKDRFSYFF